MYEIRYLPLARKDLTDITIYIVEGYHRQLRKVAKTKTAYPTDDALRKIIYLATLDITRKWSMPVQDWGRSQNISYCFVP